MSFPFEWKMDVSMSAKYDIGANMEKELNKRYGALTVILTVILVVNGR